MGKSRMSRYNYRFSSPSARGARRGADAAEKLKTALEGAPGRRPERLHLSATPAYQYADGCIRARIAGLRRRGYDAGVLVGEITASHVFGDAIVALDIST
jgi:hypothetical protein